MSEGVYPISFITELVWYMTEVRFEPMTLWSSYTLLQSGSLNIIRLGTYAMTLWDYSTARSKRGFTKHQHRSQNIQNYRNWTLVLGLSPFDGGMTHSQKLGHRLNCFYSKLGSKKSLTMCFDVRSPQKKKLERRKDEKIDEL